MGLQHRRHLHPSLTAQAPARRDHDLVARWNQGALHLAVWAQHESPRAYTFRTVGLMVPKAVVGDQRLLVGSPVGRAWPSPTRQPTQRRCLQPWWGVLTFGQDPVRSAQVQVHLPDLRILDMPVAALDPLGRWDIPAILGRFPGDLDGVLLHPHPR